MNIRTFSYFLSITLFFTFPLLAAEIRGSISDLEGNPRRNTILDYSIDFRTTNSNQRFPLIGMVRTMTNAQGQFQLHVPSQRLPPKTKEIVATIASDGLQTMQLEYFDGSKSQEVNLVMRQSAGYGGRDAPGFVLINPRGVFHLDGSNGTAFLRFPNTERRLLVSLQSVYRDEKHEVYRELTTARHWAISNTPIARHLCRKGTWRCEYAVAVWYWAPGAARWLFFGYSKQIMADDPDNVTAIWHRRGTGGRDFAATDFGTIRRA